MNSWQGGSPARSAMTMVIASNTHIQREEETERKGGERERERERERARKEERKNEKKNYTFQHELVQI